MEKEKVFMYQNPTIEKVGRASELIQSKSIGKGDGTISGFSYPQLAPSIEVAGAASELIQAHLGGMGDGQPVGHSKFQILPALED